MGLLLSINCSPSPGVMSTEVLGTGSGLLQFTDRVADAVSEAEF